MKREVKFRGQPIGKGGLWLEGIGAYKTNTAEYLILNAKGTSVEVVRMCQYTGLKDKNNNEIYEGDIVTTNKDDFFAIEYREEEASFKMIDYGAAPLALDIHELTKKEIHEQRIKVVGNVFDFNKKTKKQKI